MKIRKLNRITHRDLGYLFFGMSIIYAISGISLNHIKDWNPNYIVDSRVLESDLTTQNGLDEKQIMNFLDSINEKEHFKKYYFPSETTLKIFIDNGSIMVNTKTGEAHLEMLRRRPIFNQFNYLHYNHTKRLWTWFADIYAASLLLLSFTGLFILKGAQGITGRGAWLTAAGIIIPLILYLYYV